MNSRGNYAVAGMLALGLAMASFAWWWNLGRGSQCVQFWGPQAAKSIRVTPYVVVYELAPRASAEPAAETLKFGSESLAILRQKEITGLRGLIHARNSLLEDASFRWESPPPATPHWQYALQWTAGRDSVTVLFALDAPCVAQAETQKTVVLTDFAAQAWRKVLPRYLDEEVLPAPHVP